MSAARSRRLRNARRRGTHNEAEWQFLLLWTGDVCLRCKTPFEWGRLENGHILGASRPQKDHIVPLTHDDADDTIENIQPLCAPCNVEKADKVIVDYRPAGWRDAIRAVQS